MSVNFADVLQTLKDEHATVSKSMVRRLANLGEEEQKSLFGVWGTIPAAHRRTVLRDVVEMLENDFDADFSALTRLALTDLDDQVRETAVAASWPDESPTLFNRLLPMASVDPSVGVRVAAWEALGRFILLGELGKFSRWTARQAENLAIRIYNQENEDTDVRRHALEAIANSSRPEVKGMINDAYATRNARMRASAIFAMGRTCDEAWADVVLKELDSDDPAIRYEAIRASGELEIDEAIPLIGKLMDEADRQTMEAAIWALGEIGGNEAQRLLHRATDYAESLGDDDLLEMIEDAIATASMAGSGLVYDG